jgi:hypothetical protein
LAVLESAITVADRAPRVGCPRPSGTGGGLLELFGLVSGDRPGQDHPVARVLALAAAATVAGMKGYTTIAGWVQDVSLRCWPICTCGRAAAIEDDDLAGDHRR